MIEESREDTPEDEPTPDESVASETPEEAAATAEEAAVTGEAPAEEPMTAEEAPAEEQGPAEEQAPTAEEPPTAEDPPTAEEAEVTSADESTSADDEPADAVEPVASEEPPEEPADLAPKPRPKRDRKQAKEDEPELIPGAHLEPDLVLEEASADRGEVGGLVGAEIEAAEQALEAQEGEAAEEPAAEAPTPAPVPATVLELAADARYSATGKRKRAVARVTLKPGTGVYTVNGREMTGFFPRPTLQTIVRQPLQAVGQEERMDVVAKIHGGGVSSQAGALRHGISKALTEADPNLRGELKGRGFLTRDPRVKERKKAGLKKARKRPQFSKR